MRNSLMSNGLETEVGKVIFFLQGEKNYRIAKVSKKRPAAILITGTDLYVFNSDTFKLKSHTLLKSIDTIVLSSDEHTLIGIHAKGKPDILLELQS